MLQPHYPAGSVVPLVYASIFPVLGLILGHIRTRTIDFIALLALFEISWNVVTAVAAANVHWAIILRSSEGFIVASVFLIATLLGHPPIFYIARQFMAASGAAALRDFETASARDKRRTFFIASYAWVVSISLQTSLNLVLATTVSAANYLLIAQFLNTGVSVSMIAWTIRFTTVRLERYRTAA